MNVSAEDKWSIRFDELPPGSHIYWVFIHQKSISRGVSQYQKQITVITLHEPRVERDFTGWKSRKVGPVNWCVIFNESSRKINITLKSVGQKTCIRFMDKQTGWLINSFDFCQPITDVYCGQLTNNESAQFL